MVEPEARIARPAVALVIPEGEHWLRGMQSADRVRPALRNEGGKRRAALRLDQRVLVPRFGRIDVEWRRRDVVIAGEHDRQILLQERRGMFAQPRKPVE